VRTETIPLPLFRSLTQATLLKRGEKLYFSNAPMFARIIGFAADPVMVSGIPRVPAGACLAPGWSRFPTSPLTEFTAEFAIEPTALEELSLAVS